MQDVIQVFGILNFMVFHIVWISFDAFVVYICAHTNWRKKMVMKNFNLKWNEIEKKNKYISSRYSYNKLLNKCLQHTTSVLRGSFDIFYKWKTVYNDFLETMWLRFDIFNKIHREDARIHHCLLFIINIEVRTMRRTLLCGRSFPLIFCCFTCRHTFIKSEVNNE